MSAPIISLADVRARRKRRAERDAYDAEAERERRERSDRLHRLLEGDGALPPGGHAA